MSKLNYSERSDYAELLAKYGRASADFEFREEDVWRSADGCLHGCLHGCLWIIDARTEHRLAFDLDSCGDRWLDAFEIALQARVDSLAV